MAIEIVYRVKHKGEVHLETVHRKDAEKHDKMLDVSDNIFELISASGVEIDEQIKEDISIHLAKNKDALSKILKGKTFDVIKDELVTD